MKLLLYVVNDYPHRNNYEAIQRMCKSCSIDFEVTRDFNRLKLNNYTILLSCNTFVDPNEIPNNIKIIMGPQFFIFPEGAIVGTLNSDFSERCVYNVLSPWIRQLYLEFIDSFIIPMKELPFGVNTERFKPMDVEKEYDCLVYIKRRSNELINYTINLLNQKNINYKIFRYGSYNEEDYRNALLKSKFMLTLDCHESQGFALQEAMSCNVPLLVMDATTLYHEMNDGIQPVYAHLKPKKLVATSVSYWSDTCGIKITEQTEISDAIDKMMNDYQTFSPREYILETLSDKVCMQRILDYFKL